MDYAQSNLTLRLIYFYGVWNPPRTARRTGYFRAPAGLGRDLGRIRKELSEKIYWDEFARRTRFATIHFADYPELQLECPDFSHLDKRKASRFSSTLAKILLEKGFIRRE
jgi:hypothetical protein